MAGVLAAAPPPPDVEPFFSASALEELDGDGESSVALLPLRLSVAYQPEPLKMMRGGESFRFAVPAPHFSQVWVVSAEKL